MGVDPAHPDDLFAEAGRRVLERIDPYVLAASINRIDPVKSAQILDRIISFWPTADPNLALALNLRGNMLGEQGKNEEAVAEYLEAIRLQPRFGLAYTSLSYGLLNENKPKEALAASQKGIDLDPQSPSAHSAKCYMLNAMEKADEAKVECGTALSILWKLVRTDPYNASSLVRLDFALRRMGKPRVATMAFQKALEIAPHDVLTHIDLGRSLLVAGDRARALAEFQTVIKLDPNVPSAHEDLSAVLHQMGDHVGADLEADKALTLHEVK